MTSRATARAGLEAAAGLLGPRARREVPLAPLTTYRVGGRAALFVEVATIDDLHRVAAARAASDLPVLAIGRGSNMLVADSGYPGIVVSLAEFAGEIAIGPANGDGRVVVSAGGGVALPVLAAPHRGRVGRRVRVGGRRSRIRRRRGTDERRRTRLRHGGDGDRRRCLRSG